MKVVLADINDEQLIKDILKENRDIFGNYVEGRWLNYWVNFDSKKNSEYWLIIKDKAFAHVTLKKNGKKEIKAIAVKKEFQRQGIGSLFLETVGTPLLTKADISNIEAQNFYLKHGFKETNKQPNRRGTKELITYEK